MRIIQLVSDISYGDAVSNDILALDDILKKKGFLSEIYSQSINKNFSTGLAKEFESLVVNPEDILILHVAVASALNEWIKTQQCRRIMIYHNITPPHFFSPYNKGAEDCCRLGLEQTECIKDSFDIVLADSDYNRQNLIDMGYSCDIKVLPILIPFSDYEKEPSKTVLEKYDDDFTNILFVGRIAPNKKQEDVIKVFEAYQRNFNPKSRLFIVGNPNGLENYDLRLKRFVEELGVKDVVFTGHTRFNEILAYYRLSDVFLCMSEHEGFCVPLVESMFFQVPIIAYDSTAIKYTLGNGGVIVKDKNHVEIAGAINRIVVDDLLRTQIINNQNERLKDFSHENVEDLFWNYMENLISNN